MNQKFGILVGNGSYAVNHKRFINKETDKKKIIQLFVQSSVENNNKNKSTS